MMIASVCNFTPQLAIIQPYVASVAAGAALLGVLFALHHLRVQPTRRPTATLLFWRQATRTSHPSVPWSRRFTNRRTFSLLAIILLLLASGFATDRLDQFAGGSKDILVIDTGEETAAPVSANPDGPTLLRELTDVARADVHQLSVGPGLISAGREPLLVVRPDEPLTVTAQALSKLSPRQGASASSLALHAAGDLLGEMPGRIIWYTARDALPAELPDELCRRIVLRHVQAPPAVAITNVTFLSNSDGSLRGTLRVQFKGSPVKGLTIELQSDRKTTVKREVVMTGESTEPASGTVDFENWPADGRPVTLALLNAPGADSTHTVEYRVPDLIPIVFRFATGIPSSLRQALLAHGIESRGESSAAHVIFVARAGIAMPTDASASIIVEDQNAGVYSGLRLRLSNHPVNGGLNVEDAVTSAGSALLDGGSPILTAGSSTLISLDISARFPTLTISSAVISPTADFPRHAVFPVLIARLCDALINKREGPIVIPRLRAASDPLWSGPSESPTMDQLTLADPPLSMETITDLPRLERRHQTWRWSTIVLLVATMLLIAESILYAARRIV